MQVITQADKESAAAKRINPGRRKDFQALGLFLSAPSSKLSGIFGPVPFGGNRIVWWDSAAVCGLVDWWVGVGLDWKWERRSRVGERIYLIEKKIKISQKKGPILLVLKLFFWHQKILPCNPYTKN